MAEQGAEQRAEQKAERGSERRRGGAASPPLAAESRASHPDFDAIVVGTGFGGAVTGCRLAQAGLRILVLERGRRYDDSGDSVQRGVPNTLLPALPRPSQPIPDLSRWLWSRDQGLWDMRDLQGLQACQAAGYGGGSLIYANVHLRPPAETVKDWKVRGEALDKYYALVGYMLDVKPVTAARTDAASSTWDALAKTRQLESAARTLGRESGFFHPPIAVNFQNKVNDFGRPQRACNGCGECIGGCRFAAKNTLDLNYLALMEAQRDAEGRPFATVRTQCEARLVSCLRPATGQGAGLYEVASIDHLQGAETLRVTAPAVFLCAGALGTTELLLRSKAVGKARSARQGSIPPPDLADPDQGLGLSGLDPEGYLGSRYYPNADALAMVYDTREVAEGTEGVATPKTTPETAPDKKHTRPRRLLPTVGPTITAAIAYRDAQNHWFVLEDGGFPLALQRHTGLMRAPLWLARNRYQGDRYDAAVPWSPPAQQSRLSEALFKANATRLESEDCHLGNDCLPAAMLAALPDLLRDESLGRTVPAQLKAAFGTFRDELEALKEREIEAITVHTMERLMHARVEEWMQRWVSGGSQAHPRLHALLLGITRWWMRKLVPLPSVVGAASAAVDARYHLKEPLRLAARAGRTLMAFDDEGGANSEHGMVLLAMGRDETTRRLELDPESGLRLERANGAAPEPSPQHADIYAVEERLMRDVAATLGGELRVNPLWAFQRAPVTVHSQGGCPMETQSAGGVTDQYGAVLGQPGLHVMDASRFPTPVGVNPSMTVAALAEYGVEHFIGALPGRGGWEAPQRDKAAEWLSRARTGWPIAEGSVPFVPPDPEPLTPRSPPLALTFRETMSGYHSQQGGLSTPPTLRDFEACLVAGRGAKPPRLVSLSVTATIPDVLQLAQSPSHIAALKGHLRLVWPEMSFDGTVDVEGRLRLLIRETSRQRRMGYELAGSVGGCSFRLEGHKEVRDDPGPDGWRDTTTLFTTLVGTNQRSEQQVSHGVVNLPLQGFAFEELPSFEVHGTTDPARIAWTVSTFGIFFFGALQRVYLPQLEQIVELPRRLGLR